MNPFIYAAKFKSKCSHIKNKRTRLKNIEDIEDFLRRVDEAFQISQDAGFKKFDSAYFDAGSQYYKYSPFSSDYNKAQMDLYFKISEKGVYKPEINEETEIQEEKSLISPFPFQTGSSAITGDHLLAHAHLMQVAHLNKGQKLLEFGPGWGLTSFNFAKLGVEVTAVDVSNNFCNYLRKAAQMQKLDMNVVKSEMLSFTSNEKFDAILFNECFHHCSDHIQMIKNFSALLKPNGKIMFNSEPIYKLYPHHWGLRMDGQSIWAIRRNGWLELGFNYYYFKEVLRQHNWKLNRYRIKGSALAQTLIAERQ